MKNFTLLFAALFALMLTSCQKEAAEDFIISKGDDLSSQTFDQVLNVSTNNKISPKKNVSQYLQEEENFSLFYEALVHTNLASLMDGNNITVFAPNNATMKKLLEKGNYSMIKEIQPQALKKIMMCHISVTGQHVIDATERGKEVEILHENQFAYMKTTDGTVTLGVSKTNIYIANQQQTNGIIHQVSGLLMPQ